ncbi:MAG: caspase family protein [Deltaproteobacteria bacterium]|nr:caspase family protein [Deltaproteobacteria bacterium]
MGEGSAGQKVFEDLASLFRKNFKAVVKFEKVEDAKKNNADLVAVLDVYTHLPNSNFEDAKIDVSVLLLTADNKQIDMVRAEGIGSGVISPFSTPAITVEKASRDVVKKLESALNGSAKLVEFSEQHRNSGIAVAANNSPSTIIPTEKSRHEIITSKPSSESPIPKSDVDELPAIKTKPNKNSYAIVIGIENYRQKLPKADFATADAKTMTEYLTKVMGYPEENVVTLTNEHAAKSDFEKYFEKWLPNNVEKDGSVFIYYSGHGAPNVKTGDAYLVPYDGDPSFINETGYPLKRLYESLGKLPAKEIIVALDSCFSGAGGKSVIAKGARPLVMTMDSLAIPSKAAVLSASSGEQISSTYEEKGHGLFTYFMLKGIKGEGDVNGDGKIEIGELFDYIKPQVERIARKTYNNEQSPQLIAPNELIKHKLIER